MAKTTQNEDGQQMEFLAIRGKLYDDLRFELNGGMSTSKFVDIGRVFDSGFFIDLRDAAAAVLHTEPLAVLPSVDFVEREGGYRTAKGCIPLCTGGAELLIRKGDLEIRTISIPPAPKVELAWQATSVEPGRIHRLDVEHSDQGEGAFLRLVLELSCGKQIPIGVSNPSEPTSFQLDFAGLPADEGARLRVMYSNGLRSCVSRTLPFDIAATTPELEIVSPREGTQLHPWQWLELAARVSGVHDPRPFLDKLVWRLDGEEVCRGPGGSLHELAAGEHAVTLSLADSHSCEARRSFEVTRTRPPVSPGRDRSSARAEEPSTDPTQAR